jgi:hypothetical protein
MARGEVSQACGKRVAIECGGVIEQGVHKGCAGATLPVW